MIKPENTFGTGVSFMEMELVVITEPVEGNVDGMYLYCLLQAAVEKLHCIKKTQPTAAILEIIERPEWVEDVKGLSK